MQVSLLLVPDDVDVALGEQLDCDVRFTTTLFDEVHLDDVLRRARRRTSYPTATRSGAVPTSGSSRMSGPSSKMPPAGSSDPSMRTGSHSGR